MESVSGGSPQHTASRCRGKTLALARLRRKLRGRLNLPGPRQSHQLPQTDLKISFWQSIQKQRSRLSSQIWCAASAPQGHTLSPRFARMGPIRLGGRLLRPFDEHRQPPARSDGLRSSERPVSQQFVYFSETFYTTSYRNRAGERCQVFPDAFVSASRSPVRLRFDLPDHNLWTLFGE